MNYDIIQKIKILCVEDSAVFQTALRKYLQPDYFDIVFATSIKEAKEILNSNLDFNCILLDLYLPDSNGIETLKHFDYGIPVIVVTCCEDLDTAEEAIKLGAFDFFLKSPCSLYNLAHKVLLANRRVKTNRHKHDRHKVDEHIWQQIKPFLS